MELIGFDIESTGLNYLEGDILSQAYSLPEVSESVAGDYLSYLMEQKHYTLTGSNIKFDLNWCRWKNKDKEFLAQILDTGFMQWLIDEEAPKGLKELARKYSSVPEGYENEINVKKLSKEPIEKILAYNKYDAIASREVAEALLLQVAVEKQMPMLATGMQTLEALSDIELKGIKLNLPLLEKSIKFYEDQLIILAEQMRMLLGWDVFYPTKPKSLKTALFSQLKFPVSKRTDKGNESTDEEALILLQRDAKTDDQKLFIDLLLKYRKINKLITGFLNPFKEKAQIDERIHATFKLGGTVTGRLSCVSADTLVETPRDLSKHPNGIPITEIKEGDLVYAYNYKRELVLRKVKWCKQTGVRKTIIVTFENSEGNQKTLRLTPEHLVMLHNGDWRPAANLMKVPGRASRTRPARVMAMVRRNFNEEGYAYFFPNSHARGNGSQSGGKNKEHRWLMSRILNKKLSTKFDVDHINGLKTDNSTTNLRYISSEQHRGNRKDFAWGTKQPNRPDYYSGPTDYNAVSITEGPIEPVWDMEVEEDHNFIANGICVHNCSNPNLQQLPQGIIRELFIPDDGYKLICYDYSQLELRIAAFLAQEEEMLKVFREDKSIHINTFSKLQGFPYDIAALRKNDPDWIKYYVAAKTFNFSILYGAGAAKLKNILLVKNGIDIDFKECEHMVQEWLNQYPAIKSWIAKVHYETISKGKIKNILGQYRRLPNAGYGEYWKEKKLKEAVNFCIQSVGGWITNVAVVLANNFLRSTQMGDVLSTVHDSIVVQVKADYAEEIGKEIEYLMTEGVDKYFQDCYNIEGLGNVLKTEWKIQRNFDS